MIDSTVSSHTGFRLNETLDEERLAAREQLQAAWQLHVERVEQQLAAGWAEQIEHVLEERFSGLAERVIKEFGEELAIRLIEERARLRRELGEQFNQTARRLRLCGSAEELHETLLDSANASSGRAALITFSGQILRVVGTRGFPAEVSDALLRTEVPLVAAPAFVQAVESIDTVVAMRAAGELSDRLAWLFGETREHSCYLFPVVSRQRVVAVLYADGDGRGVDAGVLEMLTHLAGAALDARSVASPAPPPDLVTISGDARQPVRLAPPDWTELSGEEQELHLRAQRFARVQVAEMRLYKADAVRQGRECQNLYVELRQEIDSARETFRLKFIEPCPSMIDYLHLELLRTLANGNLILLGSDYPGPLA